MADVPSFCPKCGNTILPGHTFCFKCGTRRYEPAAKAVGSSETTATGSARPAASEAAPEAPAESPQDIPSAPPSPAPSGPVSTKPPSSVEGPPPDTLVPREVAHCSNCGVVVDVRSETCWHCGLEFEAGTVPATELPPIPVAPDQSRRIVIGRPAVLPEAQRSRAYRLCLVVALVLLLGSLAVGWYTISADDTGSSSTSQFTISGTATYYLLDKYVQTLTCSGSGSCPPGSTTMGTYPGSGGNAIANLYGVVSGLVIGGVVIGAVALVLALLPKSRAARWGKFLVVIALILSAAAPLVLLAAQPMALSSAYATPAGGASPASSFFGSCSGSACGVSGSSGTTVNAAWGPSIGWFLCLIAVVPLLVGFFLRPHFREEPSVPGDYVLPR